MEAHEVVNDSIIYQGEDMSDKKTDREVMLEILHRRYSDVNNGCFVRVVNEYTDTVTTTVVNGKKSVTDRSVQYERIEFGHAMDLHTSYVEFDGEGNFIRFGKNATHNY